MESESQEKEEEISNFLLDIMKDYSDSVIPSLSQISTLHEPEIGCVEKGSTSRKRGRPPKGTARSESVQKERDRRVKMSQSYDYLQLHVPDLFPKATREKIVSETAKYIILLEEKKRQLEKLKESSKSMAPIRGTVPNSNFSDNVTVSSNVTFFGIQMLVKQGLLTKIFMVFHKHQAEVLAANVAVNHGQVMVTITACVNGNGGNTVEKIKKEISIL
nr:hypothetical protein CFP56_33946 [Quercus suber]